MVLTGSVSRGIADEVSDIEMLVVTAERLDSWGPQGTPTSRVFGYCEAVPIELVWWPHNFAEASVAAVLAGQDSSAADALANGVALRTSGLLERWQEDLHEYPAELAAARVEEAALPWGG